ncbi:MBL fold metallo-hydrolase [Streptomyces shenzhenensis]|uniref:MBL fold metallo-hydrolase n=1 Tax=Streptomyces shenzhenensis TaxID=943815 RepID=UPI00381A4EF0
MSEREPEEVADGVFFVSSGPVNWTLLVDGDAVTVVDTGFPAQFTEVEGSIRAVGRDPRAIATVLITPMPTWITSGARSSSARTMALRC